MLKKCLVVPAVLMTALFVNARSAAATACENLATLSLPNTTVTLAQSVAAGGFTPPAAPGRGAASYSCK